MTAQDPRVWEASESELWLVEQSHKCISAIRSACGGEVPGTMHMIALGAAQHDLTIGYVYRHGPAKGVVMQHEDTGERMAVVFFGADLWAAYSVAIHEWAEHILRIDCCEPCVFRDINCDTRHDIASLVADECTAYAKTRREHCSALMPKLPKRRYSTASRRTQVAFSSRGTAI